MSTSVVTVPRKPSGGARRFFAVLGPGLVVMLADTDVGSIITAGQSGVQWGYRLLLLQLLLMPILYVVQEIDRASRHLYRQRPWRADPRTFSASAGLGFRSAGLALPRSARCSPNSRASPASASCSAYPRGMSLPLVAVFLLAVVWTGSYRRVELVPSLSACSNSRSSGSPVRPIRTARAGRRGCRHCRSAIRIISILSPPISAPSSCRG